jgi:hypothetical protein
MPIGEYLYPRIEREMREAWRRSPRFEKTLLLVILGIIAAVVLLIVSLVTTNDWLNYMTFGYDDKAARSGRLAALLWIAFIVAAVTIWSFYRIRVAQFLQEQREKVAHEDTEEALAEAPSILALNRRLMREYHEIARGQAAHSYRNSQAAMGVGLGLLAIGSWIVLTADETASKIALAGLTTVGTVVVGYITGTFLRAYQIALIQLNFYFRQPLIDSYLVNAERVAKDIKAEGNDDALSEVVRGFLQVSLVASGRPATDELISKIGTFRASDFVTQPTENRPPG